VCISGKNKYTNLYNNFKKHIIIKNVDHFISVQQTSKIEPPPSSTIMASASDRQQQRKLLNKDFRKLSKDANGQLIINNNMVDNNDNNNTTTTTTTVTTNNNITDTLEKLTNSMCEAYKNYPLLCKRNERNNDAGDDTNLAPKQKKKRKRKNLKNHQIKKPWMKNNTIIEHDVCIRALAVAYHPPSKQIYYGMSGQSKNIKIHRSIWGKSLVKGRKRGTCAEFKVANQLLNDGKTLDDLIINVVDIMSGQPKPRCRNCLFVTKDSKCLSDNLIFDGNMKKVGI